jgi:hypothetical protein
LFLSGSQFYDPASIKVNIEKASRGKLLALESAVLEGKVRRLSASRYRPLLIFCVAWKSQVCPAHPCMRTPRRPISRSVLFSRWRRYPHKSGHLDSRSGRTPRMDRCPVSRSTRQGIV